MENTIRLPAVEYKIAIRVATGGPVRLSELAGELGVDEQSLMRSIETLRSLGLIDVDKSYVQVVELTDEGRAYLNGSLPEEELLRILTERGGEAPLKDIQEALGQRSTIALSNLSKANAVKVEGGVVKLTNPEAARSYCSRLRGGLAAVADGRPIEGDLLRELTRRRLASVRRRASMSLKPTGKLTEAYLNGYLEPLNAVTYLTPEAIKTGAWKSMALKPLNVNVELPTLDIPVRHYFMEFIKMLKEVYVSMGFEEVEGPYVELEFWNFDALFQAQDHPAREIHDTFFIKSRLKYWEEPPKAIVENVKGVHEAKWGYRWSLEKALSLILRTQTTAVSARELARRGDGEYRVFTIDRVFRPEVLDQRHSMEFHQADGIIVGKGLTFKHLLGFHEEFAKRLGMADVRFRPSYFPFTSPSAEIYFKHPRLGWIEVGGTGIFRREVVEPLGVRDSSVLAFGMGVERIAMVIMGIDDIRDLMGVDLANLKAMYPRLTNALGFIYKQV